MNLLTFFFTKYYGDNIKEGDMDMTYSVHGAIKKCTKFWFTNPKGSDHSEDLGIGGRLILKFILGK